MSEVQSSLLGWPLAVCAVAVVVIAFLIYRYAVITAAERFKAREADAVRQQEMDLLRREDRLKQEERNAAIVALNQQHKRETDAQEREARTARLAVLREEAKADVAGNANCADETKRILAEADVFLVKICRYYVVREEEIDENDDDQEDPQINLGSEKSNLSDSYASALKYFAQAQEFVDEGLYSAAKGKAENCLLEAKYAADRIANLDSCGWNEIQAATR